MIYEYHCPKCDILFDVVKPASAMQDVEHCGKCQMVSDRQFVPSRVWFNGTSVEHAEYNPGLGCIVKNSSHRKEIAKQKGLEEIGNETPEKLHKYFDQVREEKREKAWDDVTKGWVGNGDVGT
jgi:hypothetical protein